METRFLPPKSRRFVLVVEVVLLTVAGAFGLFLVAVGVVILYGDPSNLVGWLGSICFAALSVWMMLLVRDAWRKLHHGILVQEQGLTIFGVLLSWEEIFEVYTNPKRDYITLSVSRPGYKTPGLHILKENISQVGLLIEKMQAFGVAVVNEDFPEHNG
ncbi:MAG: hypothetical protein KAW09_01535 [Thermoplasmata archaeon]|nr:hypothetical protein [Thermoplasmata archaeon]